MNLEKHHNRQTGFLHGDVVTTAAYGVMGFAANSLVKPENHLVTAETKVSCLYSGTGNRLRGLGKVIKPIKFCVAEVFSLFDNEERLTTKSSATMITIFPEDFNK